MKQSISSGCGCKCCVAPCAGAWIETCRVSRGNEDIPCRPLRGGVD